MPNSVKILAPAKINLCLDVIKRMPNGYHKIQTVLQEIPEIYDEIKIKNTKTSDSLSIAYGNKITPPNPPIHKQQNLAFKALQLLKKTYKIKKFAKITIKKNIPISSGLGGAASDAAATLKGLNKLWNLKFSQKKLIALAAKLGKDVPFFIIGGTALGTNYGEKIAQLPPIKNIKFKIKNGAAVFRFSTHLQDKTRQAYQSLDLSKCNLHSQQTTNLLDTKNILKNLHNDFEQLYKIKKGHHLCGSGPSTFIARPYP